MVTKTLKNKPLVEAILEVRWQLEKRTEGVQIDPHYKILLGRLYDMVRDNYPVHEQLSTASIPDELVGHVVQHRFRFAENDWPLIQIGPGIFALNDTVKYTWSDFRARSLEGIQNLLKAYPESTELKINRVLLKYIDAVEFDYLADDVFHFLQDKMKISIRLPDVLFKDFEIQRNANYFDWQTSFKCNKPDGTINLRFWTGQKRSNPCLFWETTIVSSDSDVPSFTDKFEEWLDAAHLITEDWFFKLIEGELERRFNGE